MLKSTKFLVSSVIVISCILPGISFAQLVSDVDTSSSSTSSCTVINSNLSYKNRKNNNKDDVMSLQDFLNSAGYLSADSVTGFFGKITEKAAARFQIENGLSATPPGFVGAGTRAKIHEISCGLVVTQVSQIETKVQASKSIPSAESCPQGARFNSLTGAACSVPDVYKKPVCTMEYRSCADGQAMQRDANCKWLEDRCNILINTTLSPVNSINTTFVPSVSTSTEAHGPNYNAMNCSNSSKSGLSTGQVACYGIWDYGNEFGGDPDMCPPNGYSSSQTGCKVSTKACISGKAIATRVVNPTSMDVNSSDIATFATNLNSTKEAVKQQIPTLWVYTCDTDVSTVASTTNSVIIGAGDITFLASNSPLGQFVVGGQSNFNIGTFNFKASVGTALIKDITVSVPADTISSVTINGVTAPVIGTTASLSNVNISTPNDPSGINIPVTVEIVCVGVANGCSGVSGTDMNLRITSIAYNNGTSVTFVSPSSAITNTFKLIVSKPTITMSSTYRSDLANGSTKLGEFTVKADASGYIKLNQIPVNIATFGASIMSGTVQLRDVTGNIVIVGTGGVNGSSNLNGSGVFVFSTPRSIAVGSSETYTVWGTVSGVSGTPGTVNTTFSLGSKNSFLWTDVVGGSSPIDGALLSSYPTNSYTVIGPAVNASTTPVVVSPVTQVATISLRIASSVLYWTPSSNAQSCQYNIGGGAWNTITPLAASSISITGVPFGTRVYAKCMSSSGTYGPEASVEYTSSVAVKSSAQILGASASCIDLPRNMHRGAESAPVKSLQNFLIGKGFMTEAASGFYGDNTISAVKDYQASMNLPTTGMVFEATRAAIKEDSCN